MYRRFAFLALALLLAYAPIDNALAGHGSSNECRSAHSSPRRAISPRHHFLGPDGRNATYRSLRRQAKSEWRQAQHGGNNSAQVRTATR
jgi:hypothetical protein